jgi:hypothetical protein
MKKEPENKIEKMLKLGNSAIQFIKMLFDLITDVIDEIG